MSDDPEFFTFIKLKMPSIVSEIHKRILHQLGPAPLMLSTSHHRLVGTSTISTRRFWAFPAGVALSAIGLLSP